MSSKAEDETAADKDVCIGGHPDARYNLACIEFENGNMENAARH